MSNFIFTLYTIFSITFFLVVTAFTLFIHNFLLSNLFLILLLFWSLLMVHARPGDESRMMCARFKPQLLLPSAQVRVRLTRSLACPCHHCVMGCARRPPFQSKIMVKGRTACCGTPWEAAGDGCSAWSRPLAVGDLHWVPGSWLWRGPALSAVAL